MSGEIDDLDQNTGGSGDNLAAGLEELSASLFPSDEAAKDETSGGEPPAGEEGSEVAGAEPATGDKPPPRTDEGPELAGEASASGPPKTWGKDAAAAWGALPPNVQAEIQKREQDIFKGIEQYRSDAQVGKAYQSVIQPFAADIQQAGIDPVQMFQAFAANHWVLSKGTPDQKLEVARNLMQNYGIDPSMLAGEAKPAYVDPEIQALRDEINQLKGYTNQQQQQARQSREAEVAAKVTAFATDPKNIHFPKVEGKMAQLIQAGLASDLEDAYAQAVQLDPETRTAEIERLKTEAVEAERKRLSTNLIAKKAASAANVNTSAKPVGATAPVGTMEDTLNQTMSNIRARS